MTEQAVAVTQEAPVDPPKSNFVKYIGVASERHIGVEEWPASLKERDRPKERVVWARWNQWTLKKSDFSADALAVLEQDGSFVISSR